jgi:predicted nucleic acid-binding protein
MPTPEKPARADNQKAQALALDPDGSSGRDSLAGRSASMPYSSALPDSRKKSDLQTWLDEALIPRFQGRILDMDIETALEWGVLAGESRRAGRPAPLADALIAATALRHHLTLVTRNTDDFQAFPVRLINPWGEDR